MTTYECTENQFVENLRKLLEIKSKIIVNRMLSSYDDGRYGLSYLPDTIFKEYERLASRDKPRSTVRAVKPFIDDRTGRLYEQGTILHTGRRDHPGGISVPYTRAEYTFTIWGDTYRYFFDALYEPDIRLEKRTTRRFTLAKMSEKEAKTSQLIHVLRFKPPAERALTMDLPASVVTFDVRRRLSPLP